MYRTTPKQPLLSNQPQFPDHLSIMTSNLTLTQCFLMGIKFSDSEWDILSSCGNLSYEFIFVAANHLRMDTVVKSQVVPEILLMKFRNLISDDGWSYIANSPKYQMTEQLLNYMIGKCPTRIGWKNFIHDSSFDDTLMKRFNEVDWDGVSTAIGITDLDRLVKLKYLLNWSIICDKLSLFAGRVNNGYPNRFPEDFLFKVASHVKWEMVLTYQPVSACMIRYLNLVGILSLNAFDIACRRQIIDENMYDELPFEPNWNLVCRYQKLSATFMDSHAKSIMWNAACRFQRLPIWLMEKHISKMNMYLVGNYQHITPQFYQKYIHPSLK